MDPGPPLKKKTTDQSGNFRWVHIHMVISYPISPPHVHPMSPSQVCWLRLRSRTAPSVAAHATGTLERGFSQGAYYDGCSVTSGNLNVTVTTLKLHVTACIKPNPQKDWNWFGRVVLEIAEPGRYRHVSCREVFSLVVSGMIKGCYRKPYLPTSIVKWHEGV